MSIFDYEDIVSIPYLKSLGFINDNYIDTKYIKNTYKGNYYIYISYDVQLKTLGINIYEFLDYWQCNFKIKSISDFRYIYDMIYNDLNTLISHAER